MEGLSLIPYYQDIAYHWIGRFDTIHDRFINDPPLDPDIVHIREGWVTSVSKNIRNVAHLDHWVRIANVTQMSLGVDFLDLDEFWVRAVGEAVSEFVKEQNKASSDMLKEMNSKIDDIQPYRSPMDSMPRPSFFGNR